MRPAYLSWFFIASLSTSDFCVLGSSVSGHHRALPCLSGMPIVFLGDRFVSSYPTHSNRRQDARRDSSLSCLSTTRLSLDFAACPHLAPLSASGTSHLSPNVKSKFSPQRSPSCLSACLPPSPPTSILPSIHFQTTHESVEWSSIRNNWDEDDYKG